MLPFKTRTRFNNRMHRIACHSPHPVHSKIGVCSKSLLQEGEIEINKSWFQKTTAHSIVQTFL